MEDQHERARRSLGTCLKLETQLRSLLKSNPESNKKQIRRLRSELRNNYDQIIKLDLVFAMGEEVLTKLWKQVFYKQIEEYRRKLKIFAPSPNDHRRGDSERCNREKQLYTKFLNQALSFYTRHLECHLAITHIQRNGLFKFEDLLDKRNGNISQNELTMMSLALTVAHQCLIYLGDLERYRQLAEDESKRNWDKPALYYQQALQLMPSSGNPHNQLAVIASYRKHEQSAVYQYFRSLAVILQPFTTARENLRVLFKKNDERLKQMCGADLPGFTKICNFDQFMVVMIYVFGSLFSGKNLELFDRSRPAIIGCLKRLFFERADESFSPLLLEFLADSIFCVHDARKKAGSEGLMISHQKKEEDAIKLTCSHVWLFNLMTLVTGSIKDESHFEYLRIVSTFCDYLSVQPEILTGGDAKSQCAAFSNRTKNVRGLATSAIQRDNQHKEQEARTDFWGVLSSLVNMLLQQGHYQETVEKLGEALPEENELCGFKPFQEHFANHPSLPHFAERRRLAVMEISLISSSQSGLAPKQPSNSQSEQQSSQVNQPTNMTQVRKKKTWQKIRVQKIVHFVREVANSYEFLSFDDPITSVENEAGESHNMRDEESQVETQDDAQGQEQGLDKDSPEHESDMTLSQAPDKTKEDNKNDLEDEIFFAPAPQIPHTQEAGELIVPDVPFDAPQGVSGLMSGDDNVFSPAPTRQQSSQSAIGPPKTGTDAPLHSYQPFGENPSSVKDFGSRSLFSQPPRHTRPSSSSYTHSSSSSAGPSRQPRVNQTRNLSQHANGTHHSTNRDHQTFQPPTRPTSRHHDQYKSSVPNRRFQQPAYSHDMRNRQPYGDRHSKQSTPNPNPNPNPNPYSSQYQYGGAHGDQQFSYPAYQHNSYNPFEMHQPREQPPQSQWGSQHAQERQTAFGPYTRRLATSSWIQPTYPQFEAGQPQQGQGWYGERWQAGVTGQPNGSNGQQQDAQAGSRGPSSGAAVGSSQSMPISFAMERPFGQPPQSQGGAEAWMSRQGGQNFTLHQHNRGGLKSSKNPFIG